jgi:hypothetical protein
MEKAAAAMATTPTRSGGANPRGIRRTSFVFLGETRRRRRRSRPEGRRKRRAVAGKGG